jgi:hypothetical protein
MPPLGFPHAGCFVRHDWRGFLPGILFMITVWCQQR